MKYLLVAEIANHFRCIDMIIDDAKAALTEKFIKELHLVLRMAPAIPEKIGLLLVIIRNFRMKLAAGIQPFRKKLPIK